MPVGWALVGNANQPANIANAYKLNALASAAGKPWALAARFTVHEPMTVWWTSAGGTPRKWRLLIEIDGILPKTILGDIFHFIEQNCSHSDGLG